MNSLKLVLLIFLGVTLSGCLKSSIQEASDSEQSSKEEPLPIESSGEKNPSLNDSSRNIYHSAPGAFPFLGPITPNAYGPGINSDATGRPFTHKPDFGGSGYPDPTLKVKPNAYGPGVGMDQYGRPVRPRSWP